MSSSAHKTPRECQCQKRRQDTIDRSGRARTLVWLCNRDLLAPLLKLLNRGFSPLKERHRKALALLLSSRWNTNAKVTLGTQNKPLHLAVRRNDTYAAGMLLEKDDSVIEAANSETLTPLLLAARSWTTEMSSDQLKILDLLLEKKADPNVVMLITNKTLLHIAVSNGPVDAVERPMEHGADPKRRTTDGETVSDLAEERRANHGCREQACAVCDEIRTLLKSNVTSVHS